MSEHDLLATRFQEHRDHLQRVAYRMLGSSSEADDALQESWLRIARADASAVHNLGGWFTTIVARVCLDHLRSRAAAREEFFGDTPDDIIDVADDSQEASRELMLADSIGIALLVVLEMLSPAERVAFVLHDMFDLSFDEVAPIVGRSSMAARQLASRARRRVQGAATAQRADLSRQRAIVEAFLAASRGGDFQGLIRMLDPNVVLSADAIVVRTGGMADSTKGPAAVASVFSGRAKAAQIAIVGGTIGAAWAPGGKPRVAFAFRLAGGQIIGIDMIGDPAQVAALNVSLLGDGPIA